MKTLDTLCYDIEQTLLGLGGWDRAASEIFGNDLKEVSLPVVYWHPVQP